MHRPCLAVYLAACLTLAVLAIPASATPPPDPAAMAKARPVHDPANPADFTPISADLGLADISCSIRSGQFDRLEIYLKVPGPDGGQSALTVPMRRSANLPGAEPGTERYTARIRSFSPKVDYTLWGVKGEEGKTQAHTSSAFIATIAPKHPTPDWAKGAVWYQIFPERFRNGNPGNDPNGSGVFVAAWNSNWYEVQPGEMEARTAREGRDPDRRRRGGGDLYKVLFDRRYGGDLQGVVQKLDDLKSLGVTAIYLNPIFQARSLHKYDASDFRHIDSALGNPPEAGPSAPIDETYYTPPAGETGDPAIWTWTPADRYFVDVFLPECKKRGLRVILDGVWNHTGREFWAFEDLQKNGRNSPYASWYQAEFDAQGKLTGWSGWENKNGYLPEFRQVKGTGRDWDTTVEKGDLNAGAKEHIFAITKRWMDPDGDGDPSDGIDGWRLDVVPDVGMPFWHSWRAHVRTINPDAIVVCEVWHDADEYMNPDKDGNPPSFDTQMHYPFAFPVLEWLVNIDAKKQPVNAQQLADALTPAFDSAPQTNLIHQNLFASHDTDRYASMLFNPGRSGYDRDNNIQGGAKNYKEGKPDEHAFQLSLMGMAIQATYLGSPMMYYGDEVGMWGADDPTCRKPMPWPDSGEPMNKDDARNEAIRAEYAKWMTLRQHPVFGQALRYGDVCLLPTASAILQDASHAFAFERSLNGVRVRVIANRGDTSFEAAEVFRVERSVKVAPRSVVAWGINADGTVVQLESLRSPLK